MARKAKYTEEQRRELSRLRSQKYYYKNRIEDVIKKDDMDTDKFTLANIRSKITEDQARELFYAGYFDPENRDKYMEWDFRGWMTKNKDGSLLKNINDEVRRVTANEDAKLPTLEEYYKQSRIQEYLDKFDTIDVAIEKIKRGA